jgi:oligopeptide transport system permease protein
MNAAVSSQGVWTLAWKRLKADRVGMVCLAIVAAFALLVLLTAGGALASQWQQEVGVPNAPPHFVGPKPPEALSVIELPKGPPVDISDIDPLAPRYKEWEEAARQYATEEVVRAETLAFGADRLGRDIVQKVLKGAEVSIVVGLCAALVATAIGTLLGALSGYFGGKLGDFLEWVYNVFTAIPSILLIFAFAVIFGRGVLSVVLILGLTGWTGIYRLVRAEFMKHRSREYVRSAEAIGASHGARIFKHILPNVSHVALVQLSLHVVSFIKSEVILSYLGLGVSVDQVSWGTMLAEAQSELILGYWWQLAAVTFTMALFVTAFALFTDALRDALDPKLRGLE